MKRWLAWVGLLLLILLQGVVTIPLALMFLLVFSVLDGRPWVFVTAFVAGILIDLLTLGWVGKTSLFFIAFLFLVTLYERKFETQTVPFIFFATFFGSLFYNVFFHYSNMLLQAFVSSALAVLFFLFLRRFQTMKLERDV